MIGNPIRNQVGAYGLNGAGFNPYSAGDKVYGQGRPAPTNGPVDKAGYVARDARQSMRRDAILRRTQGSF